MKTIQYAINCKYTFTSKYYRHDADTGQENVKESVHMNYGTELPGPTQEYLDHYKWQKRRR